MSQNTQFSDVLHVLLHLLKADAPLTSAKIALMLETNPVVVRRMMAGLRNVGLVSSEKGHGGGWVVSCKSESTTMEDIYRAIGSPSIFAMSNRSDDPHCLVQLCVQNALSKEFRRAEAELLRSFRRITLAKLAKEFSARMQDL